MKIKLFLSVFICITIFQINGMKLPDKSSISVEEKAQELSSELWKISENLKTRRRRGTDVSKSTKEIDDKIELICTEARKTVNEIKELNEKFENDKKEFQIIKKKVVQKLDKYFDSQKNKILDDRKKNNEDALKNKSDRKTNDEERETLKNERNKLNKDKADFEKNRKSKCTELGFCTSIPVEDDSDKKKNMKLEFDFSLKVEGDKSIFKKPITVDKTSLD